MSARSISRDGAPGRLTPKGVLTVDVPYIRNELGDGGTRSEEDAGIGFFAAQEKPTSRWEYRKISSHNCLIFQHSPGFLT